MHDTDDAILMQALADADPLRGSTLDDRARHRLEHSWRQAKERPTEDGASGRRTIGAGRRALQPVAAAIVVVVLVAGGVLLSNVVAQRGEGPAPITQQPDTGGVEGSFRAVQHHGAVRTGTYLVAGGRALLRQSGGWNMPTYRPTNWAGFGDVTSMRFDPQVLFDGDQMYLRISTDEEPFRWYRYSGTDPTLPPGLAETSQPVFEEGTRGFERVDDMDAYADGLTRYTADVDAADLGFLGWFTPTNGAFGSAFDTIDIWVDGDGRVRRLEERTRTDPDYPRVTRFDRFDAVDPIDPPYPDDADAPVVDDVAGMVVYGYGDPAFDDELRERVTAELEDDADIAAFEIFERSAADRRDEGPDLEDELFVTAVRFTDDLAADSDARVEKLHRLARLTAGDLPANAEEVFRTGDVFPDPQGFAAIYAPGLVSWKTFEG